MKKTLFISLALALALTASPALANFPWALYETLDIPAYSSDVNNPVHVLSKPLKKNVKYKIVVTGTYDANDGITADAECSSRNGSPWNTFVNNYESYGESLLDLFMNDGHEWGNCHPDHRYVKIVKGDGNPLDFYINDIYPVNNSGSLKVRIIKKGFWDENECKKGGWKDFEVFRNQGQCVKFFAHKKSDKATGDIQMSNPSQRMKFNAFDYGDDSVKDRGMVEYWNYDYPGPLHYKTKVLCANVDSDDKEARFMFQIPAGWPGLTGLYVVSYVKDDGTPGASGDLYGHAATGDLNTAKNWCENGAGVSYYSIIGGNLVVHE
jgi:hypothetical protein